jgi:prophage antirepressor-like protein
MEKVNILNGELKNIGMRLVNGEPWYYFKDICKELDINFEYTIDHNHILNNDVYNSLPEETKGFILFGYKFLTLERILTLNTKGIYYLLLMLNLENKKVTKLKKWISSEVIPTIIDDGSFTDNENNIDNFKLNSKNYEENKLDSSVEEHYRLSKNNFLVEGLECTYYKGNKDNILIPKQQLSQSLPLINDGGFPEIELKYFKDLYPNYIQTNISEAELPFNKHLSTFLDLEGLRKIIEILKEKRYIFNELNL